MAATVKLPSKTQKTVVALIILKILKYNFVWKLRPVSNKHHKIAQNLHVPVSVISFLRVNCVYLLTFLMNHRTDFNQDSGTYSADVCLQPVTF